MKEAAEINEGPAVEQDKDNLEEAKRQELADLDSLLEQRRAELIALNEEMIKKLKVQPCLIELESFNGKMEQELFEICKKILVEKIELEQELAEIPAATSRDVLSAKRNSLARLEEDALAGIGNHKGAAKLREEISILENAARTREAKITRINTRLDEIAGLQVLVARDVFKSSAIEAAKEYRRIIAQTIKQIRDIHNGMQEFARDHDIQTGINFSNIFHIGNAGEDWSLRTEMERWL